jgi:DNA invertase Pin-like site-specific DNA recombinase
MHILYAKRGTEMAPKTKHRIVTWDTADDVTELMRAIDALGAGDVLVVTRLDRLARSTRDLLNTIYSITEKKAGFKSLANTWADTTTSHGKLMLTVLGGLAEFERDLILARTERDAGAR